jgi:competence protein ComEC
VVLSGANVSIIGEAIVRMLSFLPLVWSSIFGGLGILCFSLMVGTSATVVRSTFMSIIALIARISGRTNSALISLCVAGSVMLLWNPLLLTSDPSFQLSFAASLGLILHAPRVKDKILWLIQVWLRIFYKKLSDAERQTKFIFIITRFGVLATLEIVASSLGTQIMTAPLILHMSEMFSIVALPINILLLPLVPLTMFSVFVSGVLSFISSVATLIPQIVSWILLEIILRTVHFASNLPFAVIQFNPLSTRFILFLYVCIMFEYLYYLVKRKQISP